MTQQEQIWQDVMELANRPGTFTHGLGLHVTGIGDGWAEGELTAGDGMLNPLGIVHGGVYAAMMDHVAGTAACSRGMPSVFSLRLSLFSSWHHGLLPDRKSHLHHNHEL